MLGTALFGLLCNIAMAYILWRTEEADEKVEEETKQGVIKRKPSSEIYKADTITIDESMISEDGNIATGVMVNQNKKEEAPERYSVQTNVTKNASDVKESDNANIRAAFVHILGDIVQSIGVVIAATIISFKPKWVIIDPICTFGFALLVSITTYNVIKDCLKVLCEAVPSDLDVDALKVDLNNAQGVKELVDLHVWSLTHGKVALTAIVEKEEAAIGVLRSVTLVCRKWGIYHTTIQVMSSNELSEGHDEFTDIGQNVH